MRALTQNPALAEHIAVFRAYNASYEGDPADNDRLGLEYGRTVNAISEAKPQSLAGVLAKARAAKAQAQHPNGREDPSAGMGQDWAWDIVNDLLRTNRECGIELRGD
jgi:hypothetical protein